MQDVKTYFVIASLVWVWTEKAKQLILMQKGGIGYMYRSNFAMRIDNTDHWFGYLINCGTCLSFWIGILFTMLTFNILFLSLPIMYKLIHKIL